MSTPEYKRRYRAANPQQHRDENRRYCEAHPERVRAGKRRWYLANRAKTIERSAQWVARNRVKNRASKRKWRKNNPAQAIVDGARRRARVEKVKINDFTASNWARVREAFGERCAYWWMGDCSERHRVTQDHLVPISRGGDHTLTNIVTACGRHNYQKRGLTALEYILFKMSGR